MDPPPEKYTFNIEAFTPDTMPMSRLADYLSELAKLFGEKDHVHFKSLKKGSVGVAIQVDGTAYPKVNQRLREAEMPDAPRETARPYKTIDRMLKQDGGKATLKRGKTTVVRFPGRERAERIGPIVQPGELVGELVLLGGNKEPHAHIRGPDPDQVYSCFISQELARQLGRYLYDPVRVWGKGWWYREPDGEWILSRFEITDFEVLENESLMETVEKLRRVEGSDWKKSSDPFGDLYRIQHWDEAEV
ncbi:MAG: hypothetical protein IID61_04495 [SAR324 cluster bacterium]|nr:hypothetical protein [SAR324 cluster bacterium]